MSHGERRRVRKAAASIVAAPPHEKATETQRKTVNIPPPLAELYHGNATAVSRTIEGVAVTNTKVRYSQNWSSNKAKILSPDQESSKLINILKKTCDTLFTSPDKFDFVKISKTTSSD